MATLEYDFSIVGMGVVNKAFASLENRAREHNRRVQQMFKGSAPGAPVAGAGAGRPVTTRVQQNAAVRAQAHIDREAIKSQQRRNRIVEQDARTDKNFANRRGREEQLANDRKLRAEEKHTRDMSRVRERARNSEAVREESAARRSTQRSAEKQQALRGASRRARRQAIGGAVVDSVSSIGRKALTFGAVGTGMLVAAGLSHGRDAYRASTALAAQSKQAGNTDSMARIHRGIMNTAGEVTTKHGVKRGDVVQSMSKFHAVAGDLSAAKELAEFMTLTAEATGSAPEDVASLTGNAYKRALDKGASKKDAIASAKKIVGTFAVDAAAGMVEMADYAAIGPEILSAASQQAMTPEGFEKLAAVTSAIAQGSIGGGATSAAEAATATGRLTDDLTANYKRIKEKTGVETMTIDPATGIRKVKSFEEVIPEILKAAKGDVSKLMDMGFDVRGNRALKGMLDTYAGGMKDEKRKGTAEEKGAAAVAEKLHEAGSNYMTEDQAKEYAKAREELDPYVRLEKALIRLADTAIPPLTTAVTALAEVFGSDDAKAVVEKSGKALEWGVENKALAGAGILGTYAAGKVGIAALQSLLPTWLGGTGAAAAGGTAAGAAPGVAGAVPGAAAGGVGLMGVLSAVGAALAGGGLGYYGASEMNEKTGQEGTTVGTINEVIGTVLGAANPLQGLLSAGSSMLIPDRVVKDQLSAGIETTATAAEPGVSLKPAAELLSSAAKALMDAAGSVGGALNRSDAPGAPTPSAGGRP